MKFGAQNQIQRLNNQSRKVKRLIKSQEITMDMYQQAKVESFRA